MNKLIRPVGVALLLALSLTGCSALKTAGQALGFMNEIPNVDATMQVGKENTNEGDAFFDAGNREDRRVQAGVEVHEVKGPAKITSQTIQREDTRKQGSTAATARDWVADTMNVNISQIPTTFLILFCLGWLLPGPAEILRGVGGILMFIRKLILGGN